MPTPYDDLLRKQSIQSIDAINQIRNAHEQQKKREEEAEEKKKKQQNKQPKTNWWGI